LSLFKVLSKNFGRNGFIKLTPGGAPSIVGQHFHAKERPAGVEKASFEARWEVSSLDIFLLPIKPKSVAP
jgi:hypothetical protein